jgi:hypothetical protein
MPSARSPCSVIFSGLLVSMAETACVVNTSGAVHVWMPRRFIPACAGNTIVVRLIRTVGEPGRPQCGDQPFGGLELLPESGFSIGSPSVFGGEFVLNRGNFWPKRGVKGVGSSL